MIFSKKTLPNVFIKRVEKSPNSNAVGHIENNSVKYLTFSEYAEKIYNLSYGLLSLGIKKGEKISILSQTSIKWNLIDLATLFCGGVVVPIYHTYTEEEVEFIINHSEATTIFVENEAQLQKVIDAQDKTLNLKTIITIEQIDESFTSKVKDNIQVIDLGDLISKGKDYQKSMPQSIKEVMSGVTEEDVASIIYTSGTTGVPKGALIRHKAIVTMLQNIHERLGNVVEGAKILTFLPLSHVLGRCDSLLPMSAGTTNVYAEGIDKIVDNLSLVRPEFMIAVPRIFEKIHTGILKKVESEGIIKKTVFDWAKKVSDEYFERIQNDKSPTTGQILARRLAYKLVFSKIYKRFGGRIKFFVSGGAPLSPEIINFLRNANLTILEGYGLTETIAPCCLNPISRQKPGTVGLPFNDVQIAFASDGEILIKTDALFSEYYKNPEATKEAINDEGWFATGDIGELTNDGYLKITDRKKDIIITSGGKNVAPQKIEGIMKNMAHISNFMVVGDQRKYLTAIVSIEKSSFLDSLDKVGLSANAPLEDFAKNKEVNKIVETEIALANQGLAQFETIKKFYISPEEFTIENGLITPSLKLRKKEILKKFSNEIDAMY